MLFEKSHGPSTSQSQELNLGLNLSRKGTEETRTLNMLVTF